MLLTIPIELTVAGVPTAKAAPTVYTWCSLDTGELVSPAPVILDRGNGLYGIQWDAEAFGECDGWIDWGPTIAADGGRYRYVCATRESGRILAAPPGGVFVVG